MSKPKKKTAKVVFQKDAVKGIRKLLFKIRLDDIHQSVCMACLSGVPKKKIISTFNEALKLTYVTSGKSFPS